MSDPRPVYSFRDDGLADLLVPAELHGLLVGALRRKLNADRRQGGRPDADEIALVRALRAAIRANREASGDGSAAGQDWTASPGLLSTAEAAHVLGISPRAVRLRAAEGSLEGARRVGARWVVPAAAVHHQE